jgi:hypothetical protein
VRRRRRLWAAPAPRIRRSTTLGAAVTVLLALVAGAHLLFTASTTAAAGNINEHEYAATNIPLAVTAVASHDNDGTPGTASSGDSFSVTFNQALDSTSVPASGTITLTGSGGTTTITITGLTASSGFDVAASYEKKGKTSGAPVAFGLSNGNQTVTATISGALSNPGSLQTGSAQTFTFTPAGSITDTSGTAAGGSYATPSALLLF